jgi:hypothetical protein
MFFSRWLGRRPRSRPRLHPRYRPLLCQLEDRITPSGPATHFAVTAAPFFQQGQPAAVRVTAEDASNLPATSYAGTAHLAVVNTDTNATLPADYTFTFLDHGTHLFFVTLQAPGSQTITVTDTKTPSITGSTSMQVLAAPVATRFVVYMPTTVDAGFPVSVNVVAENAAGLRASNYTGTVAITSSDGQAILPANYHFTSQDRGAHTFQVVLKSGGPQSVKVTDTTSNSITGSGATNVISAPVATQFALVGLRNGFAGDHTMVMILALDASGNRAWNYSGTVHFSSTDPKAVLPPDMTFKPVNFGSLTVSVIFNTAGTQTLTVTSTTGTPISAHKSLTVTAVGPVTHFKIYASDSVPAGSPASIFILALDANNRVVTNYTGTVHFTSTDPNAILPPNYTFLPSDQGKHVFSASFAAAGTQTLTVTDLANASVTMSVNITVT